MDLQKIRPLNMDNFNSLTLAILIILSFCASAFAGAADRSVGLGSNPSPLINDTCGTVNLTWTAPGDDGNIGQADHYIIKYSTTPLNESNWDSAFSVSNPPAPVPSGQPQNFMVTGLYPGRYYYLAIKTYDDAGNVSLISNIAQLYASGIPEPAPLGARVDSLNSLALLSVAPVSSHIPVYYEFALDTTVSFINPRTDVALTADSTASVVFGSLLSGPNYFWRCRAMASDHSDSSFWSDINSFSLEFIDMIAPQVTITSPANGDTVRIDSVQITWTAQDNGQIAQYFVGYSIDAGQNWHPITQGTELIGSYNWHPPQGSQQIVIGVLYIDQAQNAGGDTIIVYGPITSGGDNHNLPAGFSLSQSYPNPFNASATIQYALPIASQVDLEIYDLMGNKVATLFNGYQAAGNHQYLWQAGEFSSGTYFYKIKAGEFELVKKATLIK